MNTLDYLRSGRRVVFRPTRQAQLELFALLTLFLLVLSRLGFGLGHLQASLDGVMAVLMELLALFRIVRDL